MARPKSAEQLATLLHKGIALHRQGDLAKAQAAYAKYLKIRPGDAETQGLLAVLKFQQGHHAAALETMKRACALAPREAGLLYNLGKMLFEVGSYAEAEARFRACLEVDPRFAAAAGSLGSLLARRHRFNEAEAAFRLAAGLVPDDLPIRFALAQQLSANGKYREAIEHYEAILRSDDAHLVARGGLMMARLRLCEWTGFGDQRARFLADLGRWTPRAGAPAPHPYLTLLISPDPGDGLTAARARSAGAGAAPEPLVRRAARAPSGKIRIAYVSADFREHATSYLLAEVLELHDRSRFEVVGISYGPPKVDAMRQRMEAACDRFVDALPLSGPQTVQCMRDLGIDIAVDLQGFNQYNRMAEIFQPRAAPIQVMYLGWPGTSGAPFYDYVLADPVVVPSENLSSFSESIVWLPDCYQANDRKRKAAAAVPARGACGLPEEGFVYCCFNNTCKILPEIFEVWMRILRAVPDSVLWLLETSAEARDNLRREAELGSVDPGRLCFAPFVANAEHLARHAHADLVLDTLPYNAHTTASDALWQGAPVLTCTGRSFAGRVATSLLASAGLSELAVGDLAAYEALAVRLAREPEALAGFKARLAAVRDRPLFDSPRLTRHIERAFEEMQRRHERGERPSFLDVRTLAAAPAAAPG